MDKGITAISKKGNRDKKPPSPKAGRRPREKGQRNLLGWDQIFLSGKGEYLGKTIRGRTGSPP